MTLSNFAGVAIIPTLSRLALCAAFVTAGYNKLLVDATYAADEAQRLRELNVKLGRIDEVRQEAHQAAEQVAPAGPPSAPDENQASDDASVPQQTPADPPIKAPPVASGQTIASDSDQEYSGLAVHKVTLMLEGAKWPAPRWLALLAAVTELVGGALLLVGLFSRVWAAGLAIAMAAAFYLTSLQILQSQPLWSLSIPDFNQLFAQVGLFVLALGIVLTGPGPLSLDRLLFGRKVRDVEPLAEDEYETPVRELR